MSPVDGVDYSRGWPICQHSRVELRLRVLVNGTTRCDRQCLICGISRKSVPTSSVSAPLSLPPWDNTLADKWKALCEIYQQQRHNAVQIDYEKRKEDRKRWYHEIYLQSPEWREKSEQVLRRCHRLCEGCGKAQATIAHHLSYDHVQPDLPFGSEFLWELRGVCKSCHDRCHPNKKEPTT